MLVNGELAAAVNIKPSHDDIQPVIKDPLEAGIAAYKKNGHYPINHLIVFRDEILEKYPDVAVSVFNAFAESKRTYMDKLINGKIDSLSDMDELYLRLHNMGDDPLPYGIKSNLPMLEYLLSTATAQQILKKPVEFEKVFVPSTLDLIA